MRVIFGAIVAGALALALGATVAAWSALAPSGPAAPTVALAGEGAATDRSRPNPAHDKARRAKLTVIDSQFGQMLADRNGHALYLFSRDKPNRSRCRQGCANAWPPLKTKRKPRVGKALEGDLIGTTRRRNGSKQVTYNGHPLYFYVDDRKPEQVRCQDVREFGGTWLVVSPDGEAIR